MSTASQLAATASSARPRLASRLPRLQRLVARSCRKASGALAGQVATYLDGLLGRRERLPELAEHRAQFEETRGEVLSEEIFGPLPGQLTADVDSLAGRRARLFPPPELAESGTEGVGEASQLGPLRVIGRCSKRSANSCAS